MSKYAVRPVVFEGMFMAIAFSHEKRLASMLTKNWTIRGTASATQDDDPLAGLSEGRCVGKVDETVGPSA